jgi:hypothetical protein
VVEKIYVRDAKKRRRKSLLAKEKELMIYVIEIKQRLFDYLTGKHSFEQFEDWLIKHSWDMHKDSSKTAQDLVIDIQGVIYEYLDGYLDEPELKTKLKPLSVR